MCNQRTTSRTEWCVAARWLTQEQVCELHALLQPRMSQCVPAMCYHAEQGGHGRLERGGKLLKHLIP